jgi:hypothetical protein
LLGISNRTGTDELAALLGPGIAVADVHPCSANVGAVPRAAHDGGVAVGGHCDGPALPHVSGRVDADQFGALLGPNLAAAGVDPYSPGKTRLAEVVVGAAYNGGVAVGGGRE